MGAERRRRDFRVVKGGQDGWEKVRRVWWQSTWDERLEVTRRLLEQPDAPARIEGVDLSRLEPELFEVRLLHLASHADRPFGVHVGLGLSQPEAPEGPARPWELTLLTRNDEAPWTSTVLGDLLHYYLATEESVSEGMTLPIGFYNAGFDSCMGFLWDNPPLESFKRVSEMRHLFFWRWLDHPRAVETRTGSFRFLAATTITEAEGELASRSPAHLMLYLRDMGVGQLADPMRPCTTAQADWQEVWSDIEPMSEVQVLKALTP